MSKKLLNRLKRFLKTQSPSGDVKISLTVEDIKLAWTEFMDLADRAEQYQFAHILFWHVKLKPFFEDLLVNWDEHHAEIFMKGLYTAYKALGWRCADEKEEK